MKRILLAVLLFLSLSGWLVSPGWGQEKDKEKKKPGPTVLMTIPLGAEPGKTVKLTLRGFQLDKAREVRFADSRISAKILSKGKAAVAEKKTDKEGDTQVVAEVVLPPDLAESTVSFVVETTEGNTSPHTLLIEAKLPVAQEKEPNEGFSSAQRITVPQVIDGSIDRPQDVDVFSFEGKAGQKLTFVVLARKQGSQLDPMLTLYDDKGQQLDFGKDLSDSTGGQAEVVLPRNGVYFLSLIDAHDRGGGAYPYRLIIRTE